MLLVIANSIDATVDLIIDQLGHKAFRLNYDLYGDYDLELTPNYWRIVNPAGHSIDSNTATSAFWWKAFLNLNDKSADLYVVEEVKYIFREIYNWCRDRNIVKGNHPDFHNRLGKINLLRIAQQYFLTPRTMVSIKVDSAKFFFDPKINIVAKSLSSAPTTDKKTLLTSRVSIEALDHQYPWYLQEEVESEADLTVFVCGSDFYCFSKSRKNLKGLDWRGDRDFSSLHTDWLRFNPNISFLSSLKAFADELNLSWGRLDFMETDDGPVFLEFNANGQWVFLDYAGKEKLVDQVVRYLVS